jgi:copper chaperone NosL
MWLSQKTSLVYQKYPGTNTTLVYKENSMKGNLNMVSRILVAFASGALLSVFFLPVWRIDLFAPQYPEGLSMYIWINNITGQVDIINGLNHYIGMQHISVDMFPEFKFLPFVVGFFMLLGMMVAITGKRKFLAYYLILTLIGAIAALFDFYKWTYNYGHNLDPNAPIQVPGLSYQPPLFGHKRLLNFDAYSFPHAGGWIVVAAASLAFAVWFAEWYHQKRISMRPRIILQTVPAASVLAFLLTSCSTQPVPFQYGKDVCDNCKMTIVDPKFGGEVITMKGKVYKFDDAVCMAQFLKSSGLNNSNLSQQLLINYQKQNEFIEAGEATLLVSDNLKTPMGGHAAAFPVKKDAEQMANTLTGKLMTWSEFSNKNETE